MAAVSLLAGLCLLLAIDAPRSVIAMMLATVGGGWRGVTTLLWWLLLELTVRRA